MTARPANTVTSELRGDEQLPTASDGDGADLSGTRFTRCQCAGLMVALPRQSRYTARLLQLIIVDTAVTDGTMLAADMYA